VIVVSTAAVVAVLLWVVPRAVADLVLPAFVAIELGTVGLSMVAAHRYLELGEQSVSALLVSPLRPSEYLLALLLGSAVLATLAGAAAFAAVAGLDARLPWLVAVLFPFAVLSGAVGFLGSLRHPDFLRFVLGVIPLVALWQAPLLAVYGLVPEAWVLWIPSAPAVLAIGSLCAGEVAIPELAALSTVGAALAVAAVLVAARLYERRIRTGWAAS
jgi:hypothetical protein